MSVLSRAAAPPATSEVAGVIVALLSNLDNAPPASLGWVPENKLPQSHSTDESLAAATAPLAAMMMQGGPQRLLGPVGLGAAAVSITPPQVSAPVGATADPTAVTAAPETGAPQRGPVPSGTGLPFGPTGIGTTSTRPHALITPAPDPATGRGSSSGHGMLGDRARGLLGGGTSLALLRHGPSDKAETPESESRPSAIPALYCPPPVRDNPALAEAVNQGILLWAREIGLYEGRLEDLSKADFGRLIMLAHPDCDDPDRLLAAAKCAVTEWSVDDYYCEEDADDHAPDGTPSTAEFELGPRLELAAAAMDPVHLPVRYQARLEEAMVADPILRAFRTSFEHLSHYATPAQVARLRTEIAGWFIALTAEGGWRAANRMPPVWEYLTNRQPHSFLPCMAPIDAVGGYELGAAEYTDPRMRRVVTTAALASQMVNDLYSMAREDLSEGREFNLPTVLAAEEGCSRRDAVQRTAEVHDELVHRFESEATVLAATGSPELRRFLGGLWAWMGGNRAWHAGSRRYNELS
ncbi:family 2 encapsulin nanocompartment cargo protein terpene cyclase [Nocardia alni]|uniref:family 2 encapsulin nanocompartment cargo protein terpene cyclase n=1 Tax=Nocardia alni TaxID=2815723 RepID=UPI001C22377D|nr:family 2 encapsulin nanocompartment cargo protein terpene cyclase [Nocardia alni]